jgi:hypothetical protein
MSGNARGVAEEHNVAIVKLGDPPVGCEVFDGFRAGVPAPSIVAIRTDAPMLHVSDR